MSTAPLTADVPPRTWHQWWRELPAYWRIGAWMVSTVFLLNAAFVLWFVYQWQDAKEITALRQRGVRFHFYWERIYWDSFYKPPFHGYEVLMRGLMGRSCRNVAVVIIEQPGNQDELLKEVRALFPNLEGIAVWNGDLSESAVEIICSFPRLELINLRGCDLNDQGIERLAQRGYLKWLLINGTLITDDCLPALQRLKSLEMLNVQNTDLSPKAIAALSSIRTDGKLRLIVDAEDETFSVQARWPDGRRDPYVPWPSNLVVEGPLSENDSSEPPPSRSVSRQDHLESALQSAGNGTYHIRLTCGEYRVEPVLVEVIDGVVTPRRIEFHMPATKAEILPSLKS